ncbi:MAG: hypothetical protein FJZ47_19260 [Candidatus Tectomicrobia bacterium]|uniref:VPDSG-CTERM protein sorting domain-containing protein n=1 Tax=Tectimicrobiota bacterium TaxID=2528274 RepID=A0A938B5V3_UNCTE|nr:hypothetical protein [Candidatus Tectomicrobia bacterium]
MLKRIIQGLVVVGVCTLGLAATAFAAGPPPPAPEIDAGSAISALTILSGSLVLLSKRLRRK